MHFSTGCPEGEIRLVNGTYHEGRIEICFSDEWGTVCDQTWDAADASVVCRQLGLPIAGKTWDVKNCSSEQLNLCRC